MEEFEKVEQLVKVTGVSFEDAKNAIRACDGNIVDAMVYLEKLGKINKNAKQSTTTSAEEKCKKAIEDVKVPAGKFVNYMTKNKLSVKKGDETVATVPVGAAAVLGCMAAPVAVPAAFLSMMFGYEYSLSGEANNDGANKVVDKVEKFAQSVQTAVKENTQESAPEEPKAEDQNDDSEEK